jgi:hypothetical protein
MPLWPLHRAQGPHHAEGLVNPKMRVQKNITDFRYPRACRFRKTIQTNQFSSPTVLEQ